MSFSERISDNAVPGRHHAWLHWGGGLPDSGWKDMLTAVVALRPTRQC